MGSVLCVETKMKLVPALEGLAIQHRKKALRITDVQAKSNTSQERLRLRRNTERTHGEGPRVAVSVAGR